jgi:hypothetical protein
MGLIANQISLYRNAAQKIFYLLGSSVCMACSDFKAKKVHKQLNVNGTHKLLDDPAVIVELEATTFPGELVRISFVASVRCMGNPTHRIEKFIDSLLFYAKEINSVEVLLAVDADDDIEHYLQLKRKYAHQFRFRIFVSPVRHGYEKLHLYDKLLLPHMAKNSRMMCDYSDDCTISLKHFDEALLAIDVKYPDNIYFIHTRISNREEFLGDISKQPLYLFWAMQALSPYSYFPIISRGVLECASKALVTLPGAKQDNWSPFANSWICDCYIDAISNFVKAGGVDRIEVLPMIERKKRDIYAPYHIKWDANDLSAADRAFIILLNEKTQLHLKLIAEIIVKTVNK